MQRRLIIALTCFFVFALACAWVGSRTGEPSCNGKTLSQWLAEFDGEDGAPAAATAAIRRMGTNAVPLLIERLGRQDSPRKFRFFLLLNHYGIHASFVPATRRHLRAFAACDALGQEAAPALPALEKLFYGGRSDPLVPYVMARIGPAAVGPLTRAATNDTVFSRYFAHYCLDLLRSNATDVTPEGETNVPFYQRAAAHLRQARRNWLAKGTHKRD